MQFIPADDTRDAATLIASLSTQHATGLLGVPTSEPRVTWTVESTASGLHQLAFELESANDATLTSNRRSSGVVESAESNSIAAPGGPLSSREVRFIRVRIATENGWTAWSPVLRVEAGLAAGDWTAKAVSIPSEVAGPAPIVRRSFAVRETPVRARLYTSALGLYSAVVNGEKPGDDLLAPGWTSYQGRVIVAAHDVTHLIRTGENVIGATLADGWYRGRLGWEERDRLYGDDLALVAQLELEYADGSIETIVTDESWRGSFGIVRSAGIYDGADYDFSFEQAGWDAPGFDDSAWQQVAVLDFDPARLEPNSAPPVREIATFPMERLAASPGLVFDAGQNVAGWVRLEVDGKAGQTITVRHAEVLELDGSLHTRSLRSARASDVYVLARDGRQVLEPDFTFHGFRYADVMGEAEVVSLTAVAISSDTPERGHFESSEPLLNRLHSNVVWSQRDNFVSVPTDCPQRDERLGWTGDAQAFSFTSNTLFDTESFWRSWLKDLELDQAPDGGVASVVPNMLGPDAFLVDGVGQDIMGRAGWADAASIVPWSLYECFGDTEALSQQLSSMRRHVDYLDQKRGGAPLLPTQFQYGDWLDPDAPGDKPWAAKISADFVANAYFAHVARIQQWTEELVGDAERAAHYGALADEMAAVTWSTYGEHAITTQTGCAIALEFSIAPSGERAEIAAALAANVRAENGRIATGFLGTPLVLHALSKAGHLDEAYLMLLRRDVPSWLYQVEMGATTVWERWDALRPDGSIHPGDMANSDGAHMLSFNHYAYGAVVDWLYRTVAGLAPDPAEPGYRRTIVAPRPTASVTSAKASIDTRFGELSIDWVLTPAGDLELDLVVPFGARAVLDLPLGPSSTATTSGELEYGRHRIVVTAPAVATT